MIMIDPIKYNQLLILKSKGMKFKFLAIAAAAFLMCSCGGKTEKVTADTSSENKELEKDEISDDMVSSDYVIEEEDATVDEETSVFASDVDDMLNEYERFVDKYIALYKKAANGDMSAMSEYAQYMESAETLSDKIDRCAGEMNAAQTKRYMAITNKMTKAASELAGDAASMSSAAAAQYEDAMDALNALEGMNF